MCVRQVKEDLLLWWPKLRAGGIMAGHDYMSAAEAGEQDWYVGISVLVREAGGAVGGSWMEADGAVDGSWIGAGGAEDGGIGWDGKLLAPPSL